jgi:hypothetical protein
MAKDVLDLHKGPDEDWKPDWRKGRPQRSDEDPNGEQSGIWDGDEA